MLGRSVWDTGEELICGLPQPPTQQPRFLVNSINSPHTRLDAHLQSILHPEQPSAAGAYTNAPCKHQPWEKEPRIASSPVPIRVPTPLPR